MRGRSTLSRFARRMQERASRLAAPRNATRLTAEDEENLAGFEDNVARVAALLDEETAVINAGRLDQVERFIAPKAELLKKIELRLPVVEPFLQEAVASRPELREKLVHLRRRAVENANIIRRMSEATTAIIDEVSRIRDRHSLSGLYEKSGRKVVTGDAKMQRIDKAL